MADVGGEEWRVGKTSIDLGVYGKVACISHRIFGEKDDTTEIG
jgi:hypothetical protein